MHRSIALLAVVVFAVACGAVRDTPEPGPRLVVFQDGSLPDAREVVSPGVLGIRAALEGGELKIAVADTGGDPSLAIDLARETAADDGVVAAAVAPFTSLPPEAYSALLAADLAVLSLSQYDPRPAPQVPWRAFVGSTEAQATAAAAWLLDRGARPCLPRDDPPWSQVLPGIGDDGCDATVWTGPATEVPSVPPDTVLFLGDRARTQAFLQAWWPDRPRTVAVCGCADLTTSAEPRAQRFAHIYQATTGLDPGPYAAEGYDLGRFLAAQPPSRASIAAAVEGLEAYRGAAGHYAWGRGGVLKEPSVRIYLATALRWREVHGTARKG
jgi:hypothetical protein